MLLSHPIQTPFFLWKSYSKLPTFEIWLKSMLYFDFLLCSWDRFLFKFTGNEEEINLLGDGSEKPEFKEWSWRLSEQVVELVSSSHCPILYFIGSYKTYYIIGDLVLSLTNASKLYSSRPWIIRSQSMNKFSKYSAPTFH